MKIETKVIFETLYALNKFLDAALDISARKAFVSLEPEIKVVYTIMIDVGDKINSKYRSAQKKDTLFDQKARYKMGFKYHEAWALHKLLTYKTPALSTLSEYHQNLLQELSDRLHQKLS